MNTLIDIGNPGILCCGDWNVVQDYNIDTKGLKGEYNKKSQNFVHSMMNKLSLCDVWRGKNPNTHRYTWHSDGYPKKSSRLDYFLVSDHISNLICDSSI